MDQIVSSGSNSVARQYLKSLRAQGVRYVFANAGTDFAPIIEALVREGQGADAVPTFVTVPHENVAMAMAQGFYKVTEEPVAVMVHVTVGTANALCGLMNASRDNIPVLLAAGRTPVTDHGVRGTRDVRIHWGQESFDQGGVVREYVKWDYELKAGQPVKALVERAINIAHSEPRGPVYLTLPREVLGTELEEAEPDIPTPNSVYKSPMPDTDALLEAADRLGQAKHPLIVSGVAGRDVEMFEDLSALARENAIPVVQGMNLSIASDDPMNVSAASSEMLAKADVVLVLDAVVPWLPSKVKLNPDAVCIHLAVDPLHLRYPYRDFQTDFAISGSPGSAVKILREMLASTVASREDGIEGRRKAVGEIRDRLVARRDAVLEKARKMTPIHPAWIARCLNDVKNEDSIIVNELGLPFGFLDLKKQGTYIAGGNSGGLGRALGESLGVKFGARDRQVIAAVGDGAYMFGVPSAAHFVSQAENLATLTIINNNGVWNAVRESAIGMYPDGQVSTANHLPLVDLKPQPNYEKMIEAFGGRGEVVQDPEALHSSLEKALRDVENGTPVVLNVLTRPIEH